MYGHWLIVNCVCVKLVIITWPAGPAVVGSDVRTFIHGVSETISQVWHELGIAHHPNIGFLCSWIKMSWTLSYSTSEIMETHQSPWRWKFPLLFMKSESYQRCKLNIESVWYSFLPVEEMTSCRPLSPPSRTSPLCWTTSSLCWTPHPRRTWIRRLR